MTILKNELDEIHIQEREQIKNVILQHHTKI